MIALTLRQPIYVLGGFGGAAALLGELLGLSTSANPPALKSAAELRLDAVAHLFRPAGLEKLPLSTEDALAYIASGVIGGPVWTPNGLTVEENRKLFGLSGSDPKGREEAIDLVTRGLLRVFDQ